MNNSLTENGRGIFCLKLYKITQVTLAKDLSNHYLVLLPYFADVARAGYRSERAKRAHSL